MADRYQRMPGNGPRTSVGSVLYKTLVILVLVTMLGLMIGILVRQGATGSSESTASLATALNLQAQQLSDVAAQLGLLQSPLTSLATPPVKPVIPKGTTLSVSKTVTGTFVRNLFYNWDVTKAVYPASLVNLTSDSCQTVQFTVSTSRVLGSQTEQYGMTGTIYVHNGGEVATQNLLVRDSLEENCRGGNGFVPVQGLFTVDISARPTLEAGESYTYAYTIEFAPSFMPSPGCAYRNHVDVTITNHAGWQPGNNNCPGPALCPFGPQARVGFEFPSEPTVIEVHAEAQIVDIVTPLDSGFNCTVYPATSPIVVTAPTDSISIFKVICNTGAAECGTHYNASDYIQLTTINEPAPHQPIVVQSNTVVVDIYTGDCPPSGTNCTHTIGYWKTHDGSGPNADEVSQYLPILVGCPGVTDYQNGTAIDSATKSTLVLTFSALNGGAANGLNKLAAQLLGAKLSVADGADGAPISATLAHADALLCAHGFNAGAWNSLSSIIQNDIDATKTALDEYNNGRGGVPHCL